MFDVISVGSSTVDVFVETGNRLFQNVKGSHVKVPFGSKILITDIKFSTGGGGTNTAVSFSRLGLKTAYLGNIAKCHNSDLIIADLKKEKINTSLIIKKGKNSGYSVILDAKGHDRTILAYKGSNNELRFSDIRLNRLKTKWIYLTAMMGASFKTSEKLVKYCKRKGINVMFNPSSYLARKGKSYLKTILKNTDILVFNREEAQYLVGKGSMDVLLKKVRKTGPGIVVITEGRKGAYAFDGSHQFFIKPHKIKVIESTGAGDAFGSGFLAGIIKKNNLKFALQLGLANAQSVIQNFGAKNILLKWSDALKTIKKRSGEIVVKKI